MAPAGKAKRRTRPTNPGRALVVLRAKVRKNPGVPMVRRPTSDRWRGKNGNGAWATPMARAKANTYTVLVIYPVHVITRKSLGLMMRKLSVTESHRLAQFRGTFSRRKPSVASAN